MACVERLFDYAHVNGVTECLRLDAMVDDNEEPGCITRDNAGARGLRACQIRSPGARSRPFILRRVTLKTPSIHSSATPIACEL